MIKIGMAVGANIADYTEFDRKNYFYPDIPKGYQISQYKYPIVSGGELAGVKLTKIHLEEDTGTSSHHDNKTLVQYNRAGVPLMELVTEPVIHDAETAMKFGKELQLLLRTLGVAHANMEKGELRVEVNVSISPDPHKFGTKVEVKNINSFAAAGKSIEYEIARMTELYEAGRESEIVQETRGWDDSKQQTFSQRKKENAHDYRYFPDPDIPPIKLTEVFNFDEIRASLPVLPREKRERLASLGIKEGDTETLVNNFELAVFFDEVAKDLKPEEIKTAANYLITDLLGLTTEMEGFGKVTAETFAKLIKLTSEGKLNSRGTKDILALLVTDGGDPEVIATEKGLFQQNDEGALQKMAQEVIDANPTVVAEFKGGKESSLMFLVGQIMKASKGSANPQKIQEILRKLLA
jgi:aspartyl-tRNA(Asn)/glutamyl-tRNA(Gln) amidotransferase subunit B